MSTRVIFVVDNSANSVPVICADIACQPVDGLAVGQSIAAGVMQTFTASTNDRIFCRFVNSNGSVYELAMTCPKSSHNSAGGILGLEGLQPYSRTGTPVNFTFSLGNPNQADWDNGSTTNPNNSLVTYGDC
jgi:hypothetical protein